MALRLVASSSLYAIVRLYLFLCLMLDVNKEEEGMQEIKEETLYKMEDGSHVKHANTSTEPSQTQQIKKIYQH